MQPSFAPPALHRRAWLQWLVTTSAGLGLAACGGGSDATTDTVQDALQRQANAGVASGLVGLVLGQVTPQASAVAVAGLRRLGQSAGLQPSDAMAIGSNTKAMTSAALVALAERGGPALTMTVAQALGHIIPTLHPAYAQVTLADLLHHRGGLPAFNMSTGAEEDAFMAAVDAETAPLPRTMAGRRAYLAHWLLSQAPVAGVTPGRDFHYSNAGYAVAAAMAEAHTGRTFEALWDEALARPLGLQGAWRSPVPGGQDTVWGHEGTAGALTVVQATAEALAVKDWLDVLAPAGHWACTGAAYAQWLHWHVRALRGENTPLPRTYVSNLRAATSGQYVWGWEGQATPHRVLLTHTGHEPGFMAEVVLDRGGDFAAFGLTNTGHMNADHSSWVLARIDQALTDALKAQSITL